MLKYSIQEVESDANFIICNLMLIGISILEPKAFILLLLFLLLLGLRFNIDILHQKRDSELCCRVLEMKNNNISTRCLVLFSQIPISTYIILVVNIFKSNILWL